MLVVLRAQVGIWIFLMYERIVAFGCSFTAGHGIEDLWDAKSKLSINGHSKLSWPQQVANKLNLPLTNCAIAGSSNREILWKILTTEIKQTDLVLIHWTFAERDVIIGKSNEHEPNYKLSTHYKDKINKFWIKNIAFDKNLDFTSTTAYMLANYYLKDKFVKTYNLCVSTYIIDPYEFKNQIPIHLNLFHPVKGADGQHPALKQYTKFANSVATWLVDNNKILKNI